MELKFSTEIPNKNVSKGILYREKTDILTKYSEESTQQFIQNKINDKLSIISIFQDGESHFLLNPFGKESDSESKTKENYRLLGNKFAKRLSQEKLTAIQFDFNTIESVFIIAFLEGLLLSTYQFEKYKSEKNKNQLQEIYLPSGTDLAITELQNLVQGCFHARDLVNEPVVYLTAEQFSKEMQRIGDESGFSVDVFNKEKIKALKMEGLLTVNLGSELPPTFNILEHNPENPKNAQPIVLVGKGVVFDTGGLSLKPTANSMDFMKSDMAGAAAVVGAMAAIAKNNLPLHIIALIPATDNRPGKNAITPGDVITYSNGKSVEILNTDAEGRLILADALIYAQKYDPELVIDLATLTGSASRATGRQGAPLMSTASGELLNKMLRVALDTYERVIPFPLWEEYGDQLKSEIADIKNIGGAEAGAITAGKYLEHFTDYPWMHLDIAGTARARTVHKYYGVGGTGWGVRLLYHFLKNLSEG